MDPERKKALLLIESMLPELSDEDRARQTVLLIRDYVDDDDLVKAKALIRFMPLPYTESSLAQAATADSDLRQALVVVIETFGTDWRLIGRAHASA